PYVVDAFLRDFAESQQLRLDENFRSTARIVAVANTLAGALAENAMLRTTNPPGLAPIVYAAPDERAEAAFVAAEVARLLSSGELSTLGDVAVLYRTGQQAEEVTLALRLRGILYQVRGSGDLLRTREVQTALCYLRLALDPAEPMALAHIVNVPPRGLGQVARLLAEQPVALRDLPRVAGRLGPAAADRSRALVDAVDALHQASADPPAQLLDLVVEHTGLGRWLESQPGGRERLANLEALRALLARSDGELAAWLADVAAGDVEVAPEPDRVVLATIHAAKGDEFPVVFAIGLEETLLPHYRAMLDEPFDPEAMADELRVAYVAFTRARARLYMTYCRGR
ncbi:MAG: 3'-5' exonuclease, partial [Streptosporangiaceae bacterium]